MYNLAHFKTTEALQEFLNSQELHDYIYPPECLNPFEVREVLQGSTLKVAPKQLRLNPFEVREVLQGIRLV